MNILEYWHIILLELIMDLNQIFQVALGINQPWFIDSVGLDELNNSVEIKIDFTASSRFNCPNCANKCTIYDSKEKRWQHLNFLQYCCYLNVRVPRVNCSNCGKVTQVEVPVARSGSGFSLLMECMLLQLVKIMPVNEVAKLFKIGDDRVWRVIHHYVPKAVEQTDWSNVKNIGIDETSRKKGHNYITTVTDLDTSKVIYVTIGKDATTVTRFKEELEKRGLLTTQVQNICSDLSPAFISGIKTNFPKANHVFDKFHVVKIVNNAVDDVRAKEATTNERIRNCKYGLLKNPENLTLKQKVALESILAEYTQSGEAYKFKLGFQDLFKLKSRTEAELYLTDWLTSIKESTIPQMKRLAKSITRQWSGILNWFDNKISNGKVEALNCGIQNLKRRAKGFKTLANFQALIYLVMGKLSF
jgi:transposase